jgi:hypothetical protein
VTSLLEIDNFGAIDADADDLLQECFEAHEAYASAKEQRRFLILGRKGADKTAIFKKLLLEHAHNTFTFGHTFIDYPWHHHNLQRMIGVPNELCFEQSWIYLILMTLAKVLLNYDHSQPWNDASQEFLGSIESFVVDSYGSRDPDVTQIFQPNKTLRLNPSFAIGGDIVKASINPERVPMPNFPQVAQEVNRNIMEKVINCMNPENYYYICFDELDRGFSLDDEDYGLRLVGLLLAARRINRFAQERQRNLNIVIFLRDDIFDILNFEDKNKITENDSSYLRWDTRGARHTLQNVMSLRFSKLLDLPADRAWEAVFNEDREMTGHQTKYNHMRDRTMLRPRDMIKFCNEALVCFRDDDERGNKIDNEHVNRAKIEYSDYLLRELTDEIHKHLPQWREVTNLLRDLRSVKFNADEFREICETRPDLVPAGVSAEDILAQLFSFSVIGFYAAGGKGYGGAEYVFKYKDPSADFNRHAAAFQVHLGLLEALNLKRY